MLVAAGIEDRTNPTTDGQDPSQGNQSAEQPEWSDRPDRECANCVWTLACAELTEVTSIGGGHDGHHGSTSASPLFPSLNGELFPSLAVPFFPSSLQKQKCGLYFSLPTLLPRPLCKRPVRLAEPRSTRSVQTDGALWVCVCMRVFSRSAGESG